ncbi:MAG: 4Fe-4S dicluster domain-containing protein [Deltaproteobacteria bacterium]
MRRVIVKIDEARCDGCGECVPSCAEGAIQVVNGKARLLADELCDGLGACLGECPQGAIQVLERDAAAFDEAAVARHLAGASRQGPAHPPARRPLSIVQPSPTSEGGGCPGSRSVDRVPAPVSAAPSGAVQSQLSHWPVQLGLVSPRAPWLAGADLLLAADCVPFAYADFHRDLLAGRRVLVGCPKLDDVQGYVAKLTELFREARPRSLTVARMEVPCCGGITWAAREAARLSGIPLDVAEVNVSVGGERLP